LCSKAAQSWFYIVTSSSRRRGARSSAKRAYSMTSIEFIDDIQTCSAVRPPKADGISASRKSATRCTFYSSSAANFTLTCNSSAQARLVL
jgi:hypothetical protein